jgi:hypothetical protein
MLPILWPKNIGSRRRPVAEISDIVKEDDRILIWTTSASTGV